MEIRKYIILARMNNRIQRSELCKGLCSESHFRNYENGNRELNIFVLKRIMERVGYYNLDMQLMLKKEEYAIWEIEMSLLYDLMNENLDDVPDKLEILKKNCAKERIHLQFLERMHSFYLIQKNADESEILQHIETALNYTVDDYKEITQMEQLLAASEWDLLLDYYYRTMPEDYVTFKIAADKIKDGMMDESDKALVYPKAVVYYAKALEKGHVADCHHEVLEIMLSQAIKYLQDTKKLYLLRDILEIQASEGQSDKERYLEAVRQLDFGSISTLHKNFAPYLFCNVESICDVITKRMDMLEFDEKTLANELLIDERTIKSIRREDEKYCPQRKTALLLLEKLDLPKRYAHQSFFWDSEEQKKQVDKIQSAVNYGYKRNIKENLQQLSNEMDLDIKYNEYEIEWYSILVDYQKEDVDKTEIAKRMKELIEKCIPWQCLEDVRKNYYFSNQELRFLNFYIDVEKPGSQEYKMVRHRLEEYYSSKKNSLFEVNSAPVLHTLLDNIQSSYGNSGQYDLSNKYCDSALRIAKHVGDALRVEDILYAKWWNNWKKTKTADLQMLSWLIDIAHIIDDEKGELFMKTKYNTLANYD